jgi:hypothetical protein
MVTSQHGTAGVSVRLVTVAFAAGFLAVLVFHQPMLALLHGLGDRGSATLFGAIVPTLAAWFVVAPLKGLPVAGGGRPAAIATGLLVNGAWGFGVAVLLPILQQVVAARRNGSERRM